MYKEREARWNGHFTGYLTQKILHFSTKTSKPHNVPNTLNQHFHAGDKFTTFLKGSLDRRRWGKKKFTSNSTQTGEEVCCDHLPIDLSKHRYCNIGFNGQFIRYDLRLRFTFTTNGVFTLHDTEKETETDKKWIVWGCVEVFILHRDQWQHRFPLGSVY